MKTLAYYEANVGNEHSKSANATQAEAEGRFPMTVAAKKLGISAAAFRAGCAGAKYESGEWHHTGSHARRTDYYDTVLLAASGDFWRAAASKYSPNAAAKLLKKHGISPLSDEELAAAKEAAIKEALVNLNNFLATYGERFVIQMDRGDGRGFKQRLHPNTGMSDLGLLSGYDYQTYGLQVHAQKESAQAEVERREQRQLEKQDAEKWTFRVVTVREDLLTRCPLYGRIGGEFTNVGEARDFVQ